MKLVVTKKRHNKKGYSVEVDKLRDVLRNGRQWILDLEEKEKNATGIKSLKIKYNKVFGYFIEVTKPNLKFVPKGISESKL